MDREQQFAGGRILLNGSGPIARIVINHPDRLNAMDLAMWDGLADAASAVSADERVRAVIVEGAGDRAFVAGADISEFAAVRSTADHAKEYDERVVRADTALAAIPVPTIAAIRGHCVGGGVGIAINCDMRICTENARFAVTPARLGLGYYYDGVERLERLIGAARTAEMLFTGGTLTAGDAVRCGLVNRVVRDDALDEAAQELALSIARNAPLTIRAVKAALADIALPPERRDRATVDDMIHACAASRDFAEGQRAFAEKRSPNFGEDTALR